MTLALAARARALLGAAQALALPRRRYALAHLDLEVACTDGATFAALERALLCLPPDTPCPAAALPDAPRPRLQVVVTDRQQHPELLPPDFSVRDQGLGAFIAALEAEGLSGAYDSDYDCWHFHDAKAGWGLQLLAAPGAQAPWDLGFPLRNMLHWAAAAQEMRLLHAGTLGLDGRGVLLAGAGGAGKSGTVLAGIRHGLQSVGDDYVLLAPQGAGLAARPVLRLAKQDPTGLARLGIEPGHPGLGGLNWQGKHEFDIEALAPDARADGLAIRAVLLPRITGGARSRLSAARPREVMFALLPNNLQQLPGAAAQGMAMIGRIAREIPGHHLDLGQDPAEITATLRGFLETLPPCD